MPPERRRIARWVTTLIDFKPTPIHLDNELGLCPRTARMRTIRMSTKLDRFVRPQLHRLLEPLANLHQRLFPSTISSLGFADRPRPQSNPKESLPNIDDHAHDFVVVVFFEGLADGG